MTNLKTLKALIASKPEDMLTDEEFQMRKDDAKEMYCEMIREQEVKYGEEKEVC